MREEIGILRRCVRCKTWLSIDRFRIRNGKPARLCTERIGRDSPSRARSIVVTALGHQAIREFEAVA